MTEGKLKITVTDQAGGKTVTAEVPSDAQMTRLVPALVSKMSLPTNVQYGVQHKQSGKQIQPNDTLASAGVKDGDTIRLLPNVTAGCFTENTLVTLENGFQIPIRDLKSGDEIIAYDEYQRSFSKCKVEGIYRQTFSELITLNEQISMSEDQAILLSDGNWKRAMDIREGDILLKFPFASFEVAKVSRTKEVVTLISLTLDKQLCFIAGGMIVKDLIGKQAYIPRVVDVFLSYSGADSELAKEIFSLLDKAKKTVFLAEKSIKPGEIWEDKIKHSLRNCKSVWLLVSPHSLQSEWVASEWAAAWALDKPIIPILYRCKPEDLPKRIQNYQCIDYHEINKFLET